MTSASAQFDLFDDAPGHRQVPGPSAAYLMVRYGRMFTGSSGTRGLKESKILAYLRANHERLTGLRHEWHAHHGTLHLVFALVYPIIPQSSP